MLKEKTELNILLINAHEKKGNIKEMDDVEKMSMKQIDKTIRRREARKQCGR